MNPLAQMAASNNPIGNVMKMLQGGASPQNLATMVMQRNPNAQQFLNSMQQSCGNQNPKDFVLKVCRDRGIDENNVLALAQMIGIK